MWDFLAVTMHDLLQHIVRRDYVIEMRVWKTHHEKADPQLVNLKPLQADYG